MPRTGDQRIARAASFQAGMLSNGERERQPARPRHSECVQRPRGSAKIPQSGCALDRSCRFHRVFVWSPGLPDSSGRPSRGLWSRPGRMCACSPGRTATGAICKASRSRSPKARSTTPKSLAAAVEGCRYLFHVAADYRLWVPDPEAMYRVNVARNPRADARGTGRRRRADRLYEQRRGARDRQRRDCRRGDAQPRRGHDRPLQTVEIRGRGGGPRPDRDARSAGGDRQSLDADRPRRRQADTDRESHLAGGARPHAGFCRYRAQCGPCRRCRAGPSARRAVRQDRPPLYSRRREYEPGRNPGRGRAGHRTSSAGAPVSASGRVAACGRRRRPSRG